MKRKSTATSRPKASSSTAKRGRPSARSKTRPSPSAPQLPPVHSRASAGGAPAPPAAARAAVRNVLVLYDASQVDLRSLIAAVARHAAEAHNGVHRVATNGGSVWHTLSAADV